MIAFRKSELLLLLLLVTGCKYDSVLKDEALCPDLSWLKAYENSGVKVEIYSYRYKNEVVFEISDCVGCADAITVVRNSGGEVICQFWGIAGLYTCPDFYDVATDKKLYWKN